MSNITIEYKGTTTRVKPDGEVQKWYEDGSTAVWEIDGSFTHWDREAMKAKYPDHPEYKEEADEN